MLEKENKKATAERDDANKNIKYLDQLTYLFAVMVFNIFDKNNKLDRSSCTDFFRYRHVPVTYGKFGQVLAISDKNVYPLEFPADSPINRAFKEMFSHRYGEILAIRVQELCQWRNGESGYFCEPNSTQKIPHKKCSLLIGDCVAEFSSRPNQSKSSNDLVVRFQPKNLALLSQKF